MKITNLEINNYRLLSSQDLKLETDVTLIVGRNNSGKSSLVDLFIDLIEKKKTNLSFFDFSKNCYEDFEQAFKNYKLYKKSVDDKEDEKNQVDKKELVEKSLPKIELKLTIEYDKGEKNTEGKIVKSGDNLTALSKFIMDLDVSRNEAYVCIEYSCENTMKLFKDFLEYVKEKKIDSKHESKAILQFLEANISKYYSIKLYEVDRNKPEYKQLIESRTLLDNVFLTRSIVAQRTVDDNSEDSKRALGGGFERYYKHTNLGGNTKEDIKKALETASEQLEKEYGTLFDDILKDLNDFGAKTPTKIPSITIKSILDSEKVLKDNIRYFYKDDCSDLNFPENYNGLGYSNLIYMLLQFASFFEEFKNSKPKPNFLFLILEEPEAHMHPQMQQVFIKNINDFLERKEESVQLIITTHSSHILAESGISEKKGFSRIRYFDNTENKLIIRDLSKLVIDSEPEETTKFLRQYLTLHKCDLFFADKVVLVEGHTERMLLPIMIKEVAESLQSQYLTIIEVGGAYAQKFKELLKFINVKTLVITDLDSVGEDGKKCCVTDGINTSNSTLKSWIPKKEKITDLLTLNPDKKSIEKIKVAYQIPENEKDICGRSFEEAFILKNADFIKTNKSKIALVKNKNDNEIMDSKKAYEIAPNESKKKIQFTFDLMTLNGWKTPKYISEGLKWLE